MAKSVTDVIILIFGFYMVPKSLSKKRSAVTSVFAICQKRQKMAKCAPELPKKRPFQLLTNPSVMGLESMLKWYSLLFNSMGAVIFH